MLDDDVVIAGAGIGGSALATVLARSGAHRSYQDALGAAFGVRGLTLAGPATNAIMNLLFWVAIAGVFAGVGLLIAGARAAVHTDRP